MRTRTVLLLFVTACALQADNLEKTQKKALETQVKTMTGEAKKLEKLGQLAEARAKLKAAQADLANARLQRSRCEWRAPFDGRVRDKHIGLGQYVQPGEKLARIYAIDVVQVRLPLATDQFSYLDLLLDQRNSKPENGPLVVLSTEFAGALRRWLEDERLRNDLRLAARSRRTTLTGWPLTAARVATVLDEVSR